MIKKRIWYFSLMFFCMILIKGSLYASLQNEQPQVPQEIGVIEKLGDFVPLDLKFRNSTGDSVVLKDIFQQPVVVSLVYFNCPGICSPLLGGVVDVLDRMDLKPGKDYKALTISFNPDDTPELALAKKKNYFKSFRRGPFPEDDWIWLTGDSTTIKTFTNAVGFKFKRVGQDYIHAGTLIVISREGKISRYLRGIEFQPFDLKMAITEASQGRVGPTISKVLLYCFSYDPAGKKYVFNFMKVFGTAFLVFLMGFIAFLTYQTKYRRNKARE
jgi:protein SCO1/2